MALMWNSVPKVWAYLDWRGGTVQPHTEHPKGLRRENTACFGTALTGKFILNVPLQAWKLLVSLDSVEMVARSLHEMSCYCPSTISHYILVFIRWNCSQLPLEVGLIFKGKPETDKWLLCLCTGWWHTKLESNHVVFEMLIFLCRKVLKITAGCWLFK